MNKYTDKVSRIVADDGRQAILVISGGGYRMDTKAKLCGLIMILGGLLIGLANTPDGPNVGLFALGERKKS